MKKTISIFLVIQMIISVFIIPIKVNANFAFDSVNLYSKGSYSDYLHYGNIGIVFNYVVYSKDGIEYPAYCLNKDLDGVTQNAPYTVSTQELLSNVKVWRAITNGYPYKTATELGCNTNEEAFLATKQAVYCMLYDREPSEYMAYDEREQRVLNALTQIVTNARNSSEIKQSPNISIIQVSNDWEQDNINNRYISKTFTIKANAEIKTYSTYIENASIEGLIITNELNQEKEVFNYGEKFKILIPISNLKKDGCFNINVQGQVATKPILYGYSNNTSLQDYAVTGTIYESGAGSKTEYYTQNETKIIILKTNNEDEVLEGVKFNLLNANGEIEYADLTTNNKGEITIKYLQPGKYYIVETETIKGYEIHGEQIEVELKYNEELSVKVTNSKEFVEIEKPKTIYNNIEVSKLPKTGM